MTGLAPGLAETKRALRAEALARRAEAHAAGHPAPAAVLAVELDRVLNDFRGGSVAAYVAMGTEIDPLPALAQVARPPWFLPVMADGRGHPLRFRAWSPGEPLVPGGFGTSVPAAGGWGDPEFVVVPLVAFDARCNRLGYGGGFYDRTLAALRSRGLLVFTIGFAWAAQEVEAVPTEPTDVPLDMVVTEAGAILPWGRG